MKDTKIRIVLGRYLMTGTAEAGELWRGWELHHVGLAGFGDVLIPSWLPWEATGLGRWEDEG